MNNQNQITEIGKIYSTTDYSIFKLLGGNRLLQLGHLLRLKKSMEVHYLTTPIMVNENYEIIDGQNRFRCAQSLGLPIYFIINKNYGMAEVRILNTNQKNWSSYDYLRTYSGLGYKEYIELRKIITTFPGFDFRSYLTIATNLSNGSSSKSEGGVSYMIKSFAEGLFKFADFNQDFKYFELLYSLKPFFNGYGHATFINAMRGCFKIELFDFARFYKQISSRDEDLQLQKRTSIKAYRELIHKVYNKGFKNDEKIELRLK